MEAAQRFADLGDFRLRSGAVLHNFRLGYRTLGKLNPERSNAVLWPTWLGGRTQDILPFIGPGKVVDSGKYFVILVDAIGNGVTSSPSNSASQPLLNFPEFSIRDMVESEHRLLTETLHLAHVRAVMGISMGGMQTFAWAVSYPDFMDAAISIAGSPQSTSYDKLLWAAEIGALELDPGWNHGHPTGSVGGGLTLAAEIHSMNLTSPAYRASETRSTDFEGLEAEIRNNAGTQPGSAGDEIRQRQAILNLDLPRETGLSFEQTARRIRARMLVIFSPQDHMVNPAPAAAFAVLLGAPVVQLDSPCGHLSFRCVNFGPVVGQFLADPASVRSMTLHDPKTYQPAFSNRGSVPAGR